jgi:hypothetical protein
MNPLRLLLVFALLAGSSYAGPFGLKAGMEVEDANKVGAARKVNGFTPLSKFGNGGHEIYSHHSFFRTPPGQLRGTFKNLRALFTEEMGLVAIETESHLNAREGKPKFDEIVKTLTAKYGEPSSIKQVQRITPTSGLITATWPSKKREEGVFDLSVSLKVFFGTDKIFISYWFVPEKYVMDKIVKAKADEKSAKEAKAKKELEDL